MTYDRSASPLYLGASRLDDFLGEVGWSSKLPRTVSIQEAFYANSDDQMNAYTGFRLPSVRRLLWTIFSNEVDVRTPIARIAVV